MSRDLAPIENGTTYPLPEFKRRTGLGNHAMRKARAAGLKTVSVGNRVFVRGEDWNGFLNAKLEANDE